MSLRLAAAAVAMTGAATGCVEQAQGARDRPVRSAAPGVSPGGELRVGILAPTAVDPALVPPGDVWGALVTRTMCDPLLATDPETGELLPALASSWQVLESGTRVTFELRDDLRLPDGRTLRAQDVVDALTRVASPQTASPAASLLEPVFGFAELRDESREEDRLVGVGAVSGDDVEIALTSPDAQFVTLLTSTAAIPAFGADAGSIARRPSCVGPYRLAGDWSPSATAFSLVRNETYYAQNTARTSGGRGYADRISFRVYPTREAAVAGWTRGEVDIAPVANDTVAAVRSLRGARVETASTGVLEYVGLPLSIAPFDNADVRRALSQAIDRSAIARTVYRGARTPATAFLPPTMPRSLVQDLDCGEATPVSADVAGARRSIDASGVSLDGVTVPLYVNPEFHNVELVTAVAAQWQRALGLRSRIVRLGFDAYLAKGTGATGFDGPFRLAHAARYPSTTDFWDPLFATRSIGRDNLSRFSLRQFDRGFDRDARRAIDLEDQQQEHDELHDLLCWQLPILPVAYGSASYLLRSERLSPATPVVLDRATALPLLREIGVR